MPGGGQEGLADRQGEMHDVKAGGGKGLIIAAGINDPQVAMGRGRGIGYEAIELAHFQGGGVAGVIEAEGEGEGGGRADMIF